MQSFIAWFSLRQAHTTDTVLDFAHCVKAVKLGKTEVKILKLSNGFSPSFD